MRTDRRSFMTTIGRTAAAAGLVAVSARLMLCRKGAAPADGATCSGCPWTDLCPAGQNGAAPEDTEAREVSNG